VKSCKYNPVKKTISFNLICKLLNKVEVKIRKDETSQSKEISSLVVHNQKREMKSTEE
jgi:hypothetical protein